jgi:hypothetical protein
MTPAQKSQVNYCSKLLRDGHEEAWLLKIGYAAAAIKSAKELNAND